MCCFDFFLLLNLKDIYLLFYYYYFDYKIFVMLLGVLWRFFIFVSLWFFRGWEKDKDNVYIERVLWCWCGEIKDWIIEFYCKCLFFIIFVTSLEGFVFIGSLIGRLTLSIWCYFGRNMLIILVVDKNWFLLIEFDIN